MDRVEAELPTGYLYSFSLMKSEVFQNFFATNGNIFTGFQFHNSPLCELFCIESGWKNHVHRKIYGTFLFFVQYIVPLMIIACAYGSIACQFNAGSTFYKRISGESRASVSQQRQQSLDRRSRTNRTLVAMIATFAVASAPLALYNLLNDLNAVPKFVKQQKNFVAAIGHLCAALSITINPILYVIMNRKFHDTVLGTISYRVREKTRKLSTPRFAVRIYFHSPTVRPKLVQYGRTPLILRRAGITTK